MLGLYTKLVEREIDHVHRRFDFRKSSRQIVASHRSDSQAYMTCGALFSEAKSLESLEEDENPDVKDSLILDGDDITLPEKLRGYLRTVMPLVHELELSDISNSTLTIALRLSIDKRASGLSSSRPQLIFLIAVQDYLLSQVLDLWTATRLLVNAKVHWQFSLDENDQQQPSSSTNSNTTQNGSDTSSLINPLLLSQVRALTEKHAARQLKSILNDLEKRLLQRSQSEGFEIFLTAVILLNCVERSCWLFQTWSDESAQKVAPRHDR